MSDGAYQGWEMEADEHAKHREDAENCRDHLRRQVQAVEALEEMWRTGHHPNSTLSYGDAADALRRAINLK